MHEGACTQDNALGIWDITRSYSQSFYLRSFNEPNAITIYEGLVTPDPTNMRNFYDTVLYFSQPSDCVKLLDSVV